MELALSLGMPVEALTRSMNESEFVGWARYAAKRLLPFKRIELMLAQLSMIVARTGGAKDATVADFMLREAEEMPANVTRIEAARAAFAFNPRNRKKA